MNRVNSSLFRKLVCFSMLFISACESLQSSALSQLATPTVSSKATTFIPTATKVSGVATDVQPVIDLTPLPKPEDYIIYIKFETNTDYKIWAINPNEMTPIFITANFGPWSWSPSNKFWLFTAYRSIYLANADGSEIRNIYTYKAEYESIELFWLADDVILFNAYKDAISLPPDIYSLNINTGVATQLFPGSRKFIQAAFPFEKKWLLASWPTGPLDIVDQNEKTERFFDDFSIPTNVFAPYPPVQHINGLDKYLFKAIGLGDVNSKLWLVSKQESPQILFDPGSDGIDQFAISPNEQYVVLTYNSIELKGVYLYIFDLEDFQLLYKWIYPYALGSDHFIWSPDSQSIVLYYSDFDIEYPDEVHSGIQIMDIVTGNTQKIFKEDVTEILDWHFIK